MRGFFYIVRATCADAAQRDRYVHWLESEHIAEVIAHGALEGWVDVPDDATNPATDFIVESRYVFPNRQSYEAYLTDHAPSLRGKGLALFPPATGIRFERRAGPSFRVRGH